MDGFASGIDGKVAVLMGGPGSERMVSVRSAEAVAAALREIFPGIETIDVPGVDFVPPDDLGLAVNMIHGTFGEDGVLQTLLDARGIKYTGEGAEGSRMAFDKILAKRAFERAGVPSPAFEVLSNGGGPRMTPPLVLKPPREGSSVGVKIVEDPRDLAGAIEDGRQYAPELLVERFIRGRELTVGILGERPLPIVEILTEDGVYDFRNKYPWANMGGSSRHVCPAPLEERETRVVQEAAVAAHRALGLSVYSRVDVLLTPDGRPFVLEVNTIPGMTETSLLPDAARAEGMEFGALCREIVRLSLARYESRR